jgi:hypothetical protein
MKNLSQIVTDALQAVISHPGHDEKKIAHYFSPDYQQIVDGHHLDYAQFVQHLAVLKSHTRQMEVNVKALATEEDTVFTHHSVAVEKSSGDKSEFEVFARFTLAAGKIIRCEELTRMVSGTADDRDLGSRK